MTTETYEQFKTKYLAHPDAEEAACDNETPERMEARCRRVWKHYNGGLDAAIARADAEECETDEREMTKTDPISAGKEDAPPNTLIIPMATLEMNTVTKMTDQEMLDFFHNKYTLYHSIQMSKATLKLATKEASHSYERAAKVVTAKQHARNAGYCLDKAKNLDAFEARQARLRAKLAKTQ